MISAEAFVDHLTDYGYHTITGVPCSTLQGPFAILQRSSGYFAAPNEGIALAVAAGAELTGTKAAVIVQNSGLGNLLDPLTSLFMSYRVPLLLFVSLRGWPNAEDDEEHHAVMGASTERVFDAIGLRTHLLQSTEDGLRDALRHAADERESGTPCVVLVPPHTVGSARGAEIDPERSARSGTRWQREDAVRALMPYLAQSLVFTTTGMISRELFGLMDRPEHFYMQGSMGQAIGLGIGASISRPDRRVVVLDGDGATLMQLGGVALAGEVRPANLTHILFDNGVYDSTGGQRTRAHDVDWGELAMTLGYQTGVTCAERMSLRRALSGIEGFPGPHLVAVSIAPGARTLPPRISSSWRNYQIADRFQAVATGPRTDVQSTPTASEVHQCL